MAEVNEFLNQKAAEIEKVAAEIATGKYLNFSGKTAEFAFDYVLGDERIFELTDEQIANMLLDVAANVRKENE